MLRSLVDPSLAPVRSQPREPRDLMIAAMNGWVCAFDNLSSLPDWFSDALCRLSTGGGFSTRSLYSDAEEMIFEAKRPAILNGIEELATRGDLLDRAIASELPRIEDEQRQPEDRLQAEFESARPRLLGALLDAVSCALARAEYTKLKRLPRMADFTIWVTAAEETLGCEQGTFLRVYKANREAANDLPLETPVADAMRKLTLPWNGTATELLAVMQIHVDERTLHLKSWPTSGRSLSNDLRRLVPNLRRAGISVEFCRDKGRGRRRMIRVTSESSGNPSSEASAQSMSHIPLDDSSDGTRGAPSDVSSSSSGNSDAADATDDKKHVSTEEVL